MARVQEIMARISIDKPSVHDIDELIAAGIAAMEHDPFSPTLLNILTYAYGAAGDRVRELAYSDHLRGILRCIEQSGDGLKERSPMHIIMFSHGLDYIASKNINYLKGRIISRTVEFVPFDFPQNKVLAGTSRGSGASCIPRGLPRASTGMGLRARDRSGGRRYGTVYLRQGP